VECGFEDVIDLPGKEERLITINMPSYSGVSRLYIGLEKDAVIKEATDYRYECPVVYYGASITQGACASRPGNAYQNILSRWLDCDFVNLGFSGNAKGEPAMAEWICGLNMRCLVMDYDRNAPTVEHLDATHEKMFQMIRKVHPTLPILLLSHPRYYLTEEDKQRLAVIRRTYDHAVESGDKNIYFIEGPELMKAIKDEGTIDGSHPNDAGFYSMAHAIEPVLRKML